MPSLSATLTCDLSEFKRACAELNRGFQEPPRLMPHGDLFGCDYCAGVSDGLSCVHCGAPRRSVAAVSARGMGLNAQRASVGLLPHDCIGIEVTTSSDHQRVFLRPVEPMNRVVRG